MCVFERESKRERERERERKREKERERENRATFRNTALLRVSFAGDHFSRFSAISRLEQQRQISSRGVRNEKLDFSDSSLRLSEIEAKPKAGDNS